MKRFLAMILMLAMVLSLVGCGSDSVATDNPNMPTESSEPETPTEASQKQATIPASTEENQIKEEQPPSGIIALISEWGTKYSYTIVSIDPETGEQATISKLEFYPKYKNQDGYRYFTVYDANEYYYSSYKEWISPDFTKVIAIKQFDDGEIHAGWFDEQGEFFDVTEALGMQSKSDFDDPVEQFALGFTDDNCFVFETDYGAHYVPVENVTSEAVQQGNHIKGESYLPTGYRLTDWIDETHCLADEHEYGSGSSENVIIDLDTKEITSYVPGDSRYSWNGVLSPDGSSIAFLSSPKEGTAMPDLYVIPYEGGDPIKIETYLPFAEDYGFGKYPNVSMYPSDGTCVTLIGWK